MKKGRYRAGYTYADLLRSLDHIINGNKSQKTAAAFYNIPRSTLRHQLNETHGIKGNVAKSGKGGGGKYKVTRLLG